MEVWEHCFCCPNSLLILSARLCEPKNTIQTSSFLSDKSIPKQNSSTYSWSTFPLFIQL